MKWPEIIKEFVALFAIVDPIGAAVFFVAYTRHLDARDRLMTAYIAPASMAAVLVAAALFGENILWFFGISVYSFMVGGGLLLLLTAIAMMGAYSPLFRHTIEEQREAEESASVGVVPLAVPLLSGPGAITAVIIASHSAPSAAEYGVLIGIILAVGLITLAVFLAAERIAGILGKTGVNIFTRLLGLILAAVAVEIISNGIKGLFPAVFRG